MDPGSPQRQVVDYYRRLESRLTYALLLGGNRHFGWYPPGSEGLPMRVALRLMEDRLGRALDLPTGALVLDAGCGRGAVALHLAAAFGLQVEGVDILAGDVRRAARDAARHAGQGRARFQVMDYHRLRFPALLHATGFADVEVQDASERMRPMLRRLARLLWLPYQLSRPFGMQRRLVNAMAAVEADRHPAVWRYNLVTAARPQPSAAV
jgi:SAM-dependent methyltransferase